jgi:hypothetical protein
MTNFSWTISALDCAVEKEGLPNVINVIHWRYNATKVVGDKTYFVDTYGASSVAQPNPQNFVPYEDVTEAEVISWLEEILPVDEMKAGLEAKIELEINPVQVTLPLPWASTPTEVPVFEEPTTTLENEEAV